MAPLRMGARGAGRLPLPLPRQPRALPRQPRALPRPPRDLTQSRTSQGCRSGAGREWRARCGKPDIHLQQQQQQQQGEEGGSPPSAERVVTAMYEAINDRDAEAALSFIADDCVYEDLNFPEPKVGKAAVGELFRASCESIPRGMDFVVDEVTDGGAGALSVGVAWHVEINGLPFPNTRGCSLYRIDEGSRKLVYARDVVESPLKPGEAAFGLMKVLVPLYLKLNETGEGSSSSSTVGEAEAGAAVASEAASPGGGGSIPGESVFLWLVAAGYVSWLILSPPNLLAPGEPIWAIKPETLQEVIDESVNFFYVDIALDALGLSPLPSPVCNPVSEAFFNFVNAWSFMFLPLLLADKRSEGLNKVGFWSVQMFLTNAVLTPFLALRAAKPAAETEAAGSASGEGSAVLRRSFGFVGSLVGLVSVGWLFFARPEGFGDASQRVPMFLGLLQHDRVTFAFAVDCALYSIYQYVLLEAVDPTDKSPVRLVPFVGLARWLLK